MANEDAVISIGADANPLAATMKQIQETVKASFNKIAEESKKTTEEMNKGFEKLTAPIEKVTKVLAAMTAVLAGGTAFKHIIDETKEWGTEQTKLAKQLQISQAAAAAYQVAAEDVGLSGATLIQASDLLTKQLFKNEAAFKALGIETRNAGGAYRATGDLLPEVATRLRAIHNITEQNVAGMQLFGKGWTEVRGVLKLTEERMEESRKKAKELNLEVDPTALQHYKDAMNDVGDITKSLEIQIGNALLPVLTKAGKFMGEEGPAMADMFKNALQGIVFVIENIYIGIQMMTKTIGAFGAAVVAYWHGDAAAIKNISADWSGDIEKLKAQWAELVAQYGVEVKPVGGPSAYAGDDSHLTWKPPKDDAGSEHSRMPKWEAELAEQREKYAREHEMREMSKADELKYWQNIVATATLNTAEQIALSRKVAEEKLAILKKSFVDHEGFQEEEINELRAASLDVIAIEEQAAQFEASMQRSTNEHLLEQKRDFENRKFAIETAALEQRKTLIDPTADPVKYITNLNRIEALKRQHNLAMLQIDQQISLEQFGIWKNLTDRISGLWDRGVTAMMNGTLTWRSAMRAVGTEIAGWFANDVVKKQVASWLLGENAKTGATIAGVASRTAAEAAGAIQSTLIWAGAAIKNIMSSAWEAMAGAYKAIVGIPYVGPVLAPIAAGVAFAGVAGFASHVASASQGYDIPAGVNPLTQLHEKEMVLPAKYAEPMRGMLENGGGGNTLHYHDHSGRLSAADIERNASVIVRVLKAQHRSFAFSS